MNIKTFAEGTERMVNPMLVGKTHYLQTKLKKLPVCLQKKIIKSTTKKAGQMGFIVEPYAFFLFYELPEPEKVQEFLPDGFRPTKSRVFKGDEEKYYGIASIFRLHTSVFWGARTEFYLVAENTKTGLLSWVIMDYISDTISYDEQNGLKSPDAPGAVLTTTCEGEILVDLKTPDGSKFIKTEANLNNHTMRPLDERLWIEGNTSIAYGRRTGEADGDLFSLTFFPEEMKQAWEIPLEDVKAAKIKVTGKKIGGILDKAACFPFAQHMLSDAPGIHTHYGSETALRKAAESVDFAKIRPFSAK